MWGVDKTRMTQRSNGVANGPKGGVSVVAAFSRFNLTRIILQGCWQGTRLI
jgi:hypothetical protein